MLPQVSTATATATATAMLASMAQRTMAQEVVPQTTPAYNALEDPEVVTSYVLSYLLYGTPVLIFFCCLCCEIKNRCCGLFRNDRNTPLTGVVIQEVPGGRPTAPDPTPTIPAAQAATGILVDATLGSVANQGSPSFAPIGQPPRAALALSAHQNPTMVSLAPV